MTIRYTTWNESDKSPSSVHGFIVPVTLDSRNETVEDIRGWNNPFLLEVSLHFARRITSFRPPLPLRRLRLRSFIFLFQGNERNLVLSVAPVEKCRIRTASFNSSMTMHVFLEVFEVVLSAFFFFPTHLTAWEFHGISKVCGFLRELRSASDL